MSVKQDVPAIEGTHPVVLLIDGSGFIFRAYHRLPPLTRDDGTPTGAVYGFTNMLLKLRSELPASHVVVVFDAEGKTFRHDLYEAYKANRPPAPEDLIPQMALVREAVDAMNLPRIEQTGMEADDIIATYTRQATEAGMEVCIVSSDKDLMQLMDDAAYVRMWDPLKARQMTLEDVKQKFGVEPDQIAEVQALMGDSIDNIPGVPGIGPKIAAELIQQYGSLEEVLAHTGDIPQKKRRERLEEHAEEARISRKLVELKDDCEALPPLDECAVAPFEPKTLIRFCEEQAFHSTVKRLRKEYDISENDLPPALPEEEVDVHTPAQRHYYVIRDKDALSELVKRMLASRAVAFDVETDSLNAMRAQLVGMSFSMQSGEAYYIPLQHKDPEAGSNGSKQSPDLFDGDGEGALSEGQVALDEALALLKPVLTSTSILKIGHNLKYDLLVMRHYDIAVTPIDDTMLMSYCLGAGSHGHGMDELAKRYLNITTTPYSEVAGKGKSQVRFDDVPIDVAGDYAAEDAYITWRLWAYFKPRLLKAGLATVYERTERALVPVIVSMEEHGVQVDRSQLDTLSSRFANDMTKLEERIHDLAGHRFNVGSPKQLGEVIFDELQLGKGKKSSKSGAYVTDAETLEELAAQGHELPEKALEWRQLSKLKSTYADALKGQIHPRTGRLHTSYSMASTSTGRLSSSDPNLQNIPIRTEQGRLIRDAFIADEGYTLLSADYSQIELRLLADIADIKELKDAFRNGEDIHSITASQVFGISADKVDKELRRKAKTINFGIIYGISAWGLATRLGIPRKEASRYIDAYFKQYPGIEAYMERAKETARHHGYVETLWGRRCHIPDITSQNANRRSFAERAAINAPLQGSAADIIKRAMVAVDGLLKAQDVKTRMLLQVHDELVFELAAGEETIIDHIRRTMEGVASLSVPLEVETGTGEHWSAAH